MTKKRVGGYLFGRIGVSMKDIGLMENIMDKELYELFKEKYNKELGLMANIKIIIHKEIFLF